MLWIFSPFLSCFYYAWHIVQHFSIFICSFLYIFENWKRNSFSIVSDTKKDKNILLTIAYFLIPLPRNGKCFIIKNSCYGASYHYTKMYQTFNGVNEYFSWNFNDNTQRWNWWWCYLQLHQVNLKIKKKVKTIITETNSIKM